MSLIKKLFILSILIITLFIVGCSKDSENPINPGNGNGGNGGNNGGNNSQSTLTINGAGYNNKQIGSNSGVGVYVSPETMTYIAFWASSGTDSLTASINIPGTQTGTYSWVNAEQGLYFSTGTSVNARVFYPTSDGATIITEFGGVGNKIAGTLQGKVFDVISGDTANVFASFSVMRAPDEIE
jgi:hypothetical protein